MDASISISLKTLICLLATATFCGFTSLWQMRCKWRCIKALQVSCKAVFKCAENFGTWPNSFRVGPRTSNSIPSTTSPFCTTAKILTMFGCCRMCSFCASARSASLSLVSCPGRSCWRRRGLQSFAALNKPLHLTLRRLPYRLFRARHQS